MYDVVKLACLSAVLAGALLAAADRGGEQPPAGQFLVERLGQRPSQPPSSQSAERDRVQAAATCSGAWPYACPTGQPARSVRVIGAAVAPVAGTRDKQ